MQFFCTLFWTNWCHPDKDWLVVNSFWNQFALFCYIFSHSQQLEEIRKLLEEISQAETCCCKELFTSQLHVDSLFLPMLLEAKAKETIPVVETVAEIIEAPAIPSAQPLQRNLLMLCIIIVKLVSFLDITFLLYTVHNFSTFQFIPYCSIPLQVQKSLRDLRATVGTSKWSVEGSWNQRTSIDSDPNVERCLCKDIYIETCRSIMQRS